MSQAQAMATNFIQPTAGPGMKRCAWCEAVKPVSSFSAKDSVCCVCRGKNATTIALGLRDSGQMRRITEQFTQWIQKLNEEHPDVPSMSTLMSSLIVKLGGVNEMVTYWATALTDPKTNARTRIMGFEAIAKFCMKAGEQNAVLGELRKMGDGQLQQLAVQMFTEELGGDALDEIYRAKAAERGLKVLLVEEQAVVEAAVVPATEPATETAAPPTEAPGG